MRACGLSDEQIRNLFPKDTPGDSAPSPSEKEEQVPAPSAEDAAEVGWLTENLIRRYCARNGMDVSEDTLRQMLRDVGCDNLNGDFATLSKRVFDWVDMS